MKENEFPKGLPLGPRNWSHAMEQLRLKPEFIVVPTDADAPIWGMQLVYNDTIVLWRHWFGFGPEWNPVKEA